MQMPPPSKASQAERKNPMTIQILVSVQPLLPGERFDAIKSCEPSSAWTAIGSMRIFLVQREAEREHNNRS
jgi:hypothetical protein